MKKKIDTRFWAQAALIAALYTVLVLAFQPISFGPVQLRIAEALCILPFFTFAALPGLTIGCLLSNVIGLFLGMTVIVDVPLGTAATLLAALAGYALRKRFYLVPLPAVLFNAVIVGWEIHTFFTPAVPLWLCMAYIAAGQALACYGLGLPLLLLLDRSKVLRRLLVAPPPPSASPRRK